MKKMIALAGLSLLIGTAAPAVAGSQQEKMRMCNKEAKEKALTGEERKTFITSCLSKEGEAVANDSKVDEPAAGKVDVAPADKADRRSARHEKKKLCKNEAKEKALAGEDRKTFMKTCLGKNADAASSGDKDEVTHTDKKGVQQEKLMMCNKNAREKALKGPERRKFMSECLKG